MRVPTKRTPAARTKKIFFIKSFLYIELKPVGLNHSLKRASDSFKIKIGQHEEEEREVERPTLHKIDPTEYI